MDDPSAYLLSGLLGRHFGLGRIARFRQVTRGRQAVTHELLTAQQNEYLIHQYPPPFSADTVNRIGPLLSFLHAENFSVLPFLPSKQGAYQVEGPQHTRLLVGLNPVGQMRLPDEWAPHHLTELGLRLAWMARLLRQYHAAEAAAAQSPDAPAPLAAPFPTPDPLAEQLDDLLLTPNITQRLGVDESTIRTWIDRLAAAQFAPTLVHGDIHPASLLIDADYQLRSITDWALVHLGHPQEDLVAALVHWTLKSDGTINAEAARHILEAFLTLETIPPDAWPVAVDAFLAQHAIDTAAERRTMPRVFAALASNPAPFVAALNYIATEK